jgi:hypothetical protein
MIRQRRETVGELANFDVKPLKQVRLSLDRLSSEGYGGEYRIGLPSQLTVKIR